MTEVQSLSIIYIKNNSFAFRYVTSQIWKYYGIFGFVTNERGRIHEHKAPHRKPLKYTLLSVRDAFRISTWPLSSGLCFQVAFTVLLLAVIKNRRSVSGHQHRITAGAPFCIGVNCLYSFCKSHCTGRHFRMRFSVFFFIFLVLYYPNATDAKMQKIEPDPSFFYDGRKFRRKCVNVIDTT